MTVTQGALTSLEGTTVLVTVDLPETDIPARISTSAISTTETALLTQLAKTPMERTNVTVTLVIPETDLNPALISMSAN